jgi:hypothetical protein
VGAINFFKPKPKIMGQVENRITLSRNTHKFLPDHHWGGVSIGEIAKNEYPSQATVNYFFFCESSI